MARDWYDGEGNWIASTMPPETRERYWICFALYACGEDRLADAVILKGRTDRSHMGDELSSPFDIFHTNIACLLLKLHPDRMSAEVRRRLEDLVRGGFEFQPGNRRPDYQFHGYNDNMPAKATMGLILGGEMLGDPKAVEHGVWNLLQLRNMLARRGTISEWNSPTYFPITIHSIAEIAEHARHAEARELARGIEERLWLDLASRFHPEVGGLAGPYSRAYTSDTLAHLSCVSALVWFMLGDVARPSPMDLFNPRSGLVMHHMGDAPFNISQMCWLASGTYHPSARVLDLMVRKTYPFHSVATAEMGYVPLDFPARPVRLETFMQRDFTVGTSSTQFLSGEQAAPYFVTYKRRKNVVSFADVGTAFHKFVINGEEPGTVVSPNCPDGRPYANSGEQDNLDSHGNTITLQSGPSVLLLTHPSLSLAGLEETQKPADLKRLDELVVFPSHFGGADEARIGCRKVDSWPADVARGEWVGFRRGRLLVGIRPLVYLPEPGTVQIALEKANKYEVLRSTFYRGGSRRFTRGELRNMFGGFVAEHACVDEYPSLATFMEDLSRGLFTDYYWTTRRVRYRRPSSAKRAALEFEVSWSPGSVAPRYALINGREVSQDTRVSIDGMKSSEFPFLEDPWMPSAPFFPWPKIEATWGDVMAEGVIGDRE